MDPVCFLGGIETSLDEPPSAQVVPQTLQRDLGGLVQLEVLPGVWKPTREEPVETLQASNAVV